MRWKGVGVKSVKRVLYGMDSIIILIFCTFVYYDKMTIYFELLWYTLLIIIMFMIYRSINYLVENSKEISEKVCDELVGNNE